MLESFRKHDRELRCSVFALCVAAAFAIPALHAYKYRTVRDEGVEFRFRCGGSDPYTPFLGRYLTVRLLPREFETGRTAAVDMNSSAYVTFHTGKDGFAEIVSCSGSKPANMTGVWKFPPRSFSAGRNTVYFFRYPVNRYYLNEKRAKTADRLKLRPDDITAYVRLKDGSGIITRLTVKGEDLEKYLRKQKGE